MTRYFLLLAAFAMFALPATVQADTITFTITPTAPNTNNNTDNTNETDYHGGPNQFDLDHHRAYTWKIRNIVLPPGHTITGASITFRGIANWDVNPNQLFVHLLNNANNNGIASVVDASGVPVTNISDYFGAANGLGPAPGANNILLFQRGFNMVGQGPSANWAGPGGYVAQDFTYNFTADQLVTLGLFIAAGNNIAFGFDPDCHFWNNGIVFTIHTAPQTVPTPEPATLALFGSGLLSGAAYLRRRKNQKGTKKLEQQ